MSGSSSESDDEQSGAPARAVADAVLELVEAIGALPLEEAAKVRLGEHISRLGSLVERDTKSPAFNEMRLWSDLDRFVIGAGQWVLFCGDIDGFKQLNDELGLVHADLVLRWTGSQLVNIANESGGNAYRRGGDEFALIVPYASFIEVDSKLRRLPEDAETKWSRRMRVSFGFARSSAGITGEQWREQAELAAKCAKWSPGPVVEFDEELDPGRSARSRCEKCRSQYIVSTPPRTSPNTKSTCVVCGEEIRLAFG